MIKSISIIIPTYNAEHHIAKCLQAIMEQDYALDNVEIIIADNCSTDDTLEVVQKFQLNLKIVKECTYQNSPYSARNRGFEISTGDIIILLDSDCTPEKYWLSEGINALLKYSADLVGGKVIFSYNNKYSLAEMYDSIMNIKMKESIERYRCAKTANLFIKRKVFDDIGLFPERARSGFDVIWTRKAADSDFKLIYCDGAVVYKPTRGFKTLLKKQWRVAKAQPVIWKETNDLKTMMISLIKIAIPPSTIRHSINEYGQPYMQKYITKLFLFSILIRTLMIGGNVYGLALLTLRSLKKTFRKSK